MTAPVLLWDNGKPRSRGGPFDILYEPRKAPIVVPAEEKLKKASKVKANLTRDNTGFSLALANQADADKQQRIKKAAV